LSSIIIACATIIVWPILAICNRTAAFEHGDDLRRPPNPELLDARDLSTPGNWLRFRLRHAVPGLDPGIDPCIQGRRSRIINNGAASTPGMAGGGGWTSPVRDREPADQPLQDPQPAIRRLASPPDARRGGATGVGVAVSAVVCSLHRGNVGPNRRFHLTIARAAVRTPALAKTEAAVSL
jgi:hypothetical protein